MSLDSMHKRQQNVHKKFAGLKKVSPQTKKNEYLKAKVLHNAGDIFKEFYYIYKERYKNEKDVLNKKRHKEIWLHKITTHWWLSVKVWRRGKTS